MNKVMALAILIALLISACGNASPTPQAATPIPKATATLETTRPPTPTDTHLPSATPAPTTTPLPVYTPSPADHTVCASGCDFTTIQSAIDSANVASGAVIEVTDPIHTEAGIIVNKDVTIRGHGADVTIVQAHETLEESPERVFSVPEGITVIIEDLTIRHGWPSNEKEHGGGVENYGNLTLRNCIITKNSARGGGGVSSRTGSLTVISCTVSDNVARGDGPRGEECGGGGGLKCSSGTMTVINSTVTGNQAGIKAEGLGGGIRTGCACTSEILNTTVSGNSAVRYGGGIAAAGTVQITNCTITENSVRSRGGALWIRDVTDIENTIIAGNIGGGDCVFGGQGGLLGTGELGTTKNNFIGDGSCNADFSGDPMLGPLADNGGTTLTYALLPGSPAIDAIPAANCPISTDQRGAPRSIALTSPDTACDIGAFELQDD
jgi:predicted outer membrane repeat protein